jgi:hypothetical protein
MSHSCRIDYKARKKYTILFLSFRRKDLEGLCHISFNDFLNYFFKKGGLSPEDVARLDYIVEVVRYLEGAYKSNAMITWFARPRKELKYLAPQSYLLTPWNPKDFWPQKILALAKSLKGGK